MINDVKFYYHRQDLFKFNIIQDLINFLKNKKYQVKDIHKIDINKEKILAQEKNVFICGCVGERKAKERSNIYRFFRKYDKPVIIFDRNFFLFSDNNKKNLTRSFRIQLNSLYEESTLQLFENPIENRWEKFKKIYNIELKPWRKSGDHIIIMLNNTLGNMNIDEKLYSYINETLENVRKYTDRKILFFTHWRERANKEIIKSKINFDKINNYHFFYREDFNNYLNNCWCFVTRNSSSSLNAIINGIPVFLDKNSKPFTEKLANFNIENIENPLMPEREEVLNNLAHRIWFKDEIDVYGNQILKVLSDKYFK